MSVTVPRVVVAGGTFRNLDPERRILGAIGAQVIDANRLPRAEVISLARDADALMSDYFIVDSSVITALRCCRVICRYGIGLDKVDVQKATEAGIVVTRVPEYCISELADHTLGLLLAVARRIPRYNSAVHRKDWNWDSPGIRRLSGATLGIIGLGRIGSSLATRAKAMGMVILAHDPNLRTDEIHARGAESTSLDEILAKSDIVSLHTPLTPATRHLIGTAQLSAMKPGAILINTARGGLVDQEALVESLRSGKLGGAGLDVLASEPPDPEDPILSLENVVLTPHAGHFSEESLVQVQVEAGEEVLRALKGEPLLNAVNEKDVLGRRVP